MRELSDVEYLVDTREQQPWKALKGDTLLRVKLDYGDYSLAGFERRICVERKNLDDFCGSVFGDWGRFGARLEEFRGLERAAIVVECTEQDIRERTYVPDRRSTRRMGKSAIWAAKLDALTPARVMSSCAWIFAKYGVPVFLAGSPTRAATLGFSILRLWHDHQRTI